MGRGNTAPISSVNPQFKTDLTKKLQKRLLSTQEAATYLGISIPTFRRYREMGRIPFKKVGDKLYKYEVADLDDFARKVGT